MMVDGNMNMTSLWDVMDYGWHEMRWDLGNVIWRKSGVM